MNVDKVSKSCSSNNRLNDISDGNKTIKSNLSCKRVLCSSGAAKPSTSNKNEVKSSSSNTTRTWNESCKRLLCSFGGSKSNPSNPTRIGLNKKIEIRSPVEGSSKNESRLLMNKSSLASPKHVIPCSNNKEKESGQTDSSNASNPTQIHKTAVPKDPAPNKLRNKVEKSEVSKDSAVTTRKKEIHKTDIPKDSLIGTKKTKTQRAEKQKTDIPKVPLLFNIWFWDGKVYEHPLLMVCAFLGMHPRVVGADTLYPPLVITFFFQVFNCYREYFCLHFEAFQLGMAPVYMAFGRFMGDEVEARSFSYSLEVGRNGGKLMWEGTPRSIRDSHRKVKDSHDELIIQRNMALFFSGGDRKELKLVTGKIWKEQQNPESGVCIPNHFT